MNCEKCEMMREARVKVDGKNRPVVHCIVRAAGQVCKCSKPVAPRPASLPSQGAGAAGPVKEKS